MRRLPALALALLAIALPASAAAADGPRHPGGLDREARAPHSVRVTVKVPGDLAPGDVQASMGSLAGGRRERAPGRPRPATAPGAGDRHLPEHVRQAADRGHRGRPPPDRRGRQRRQGRPGHLRRQRPRDRTAQQQRRGRGNALSVVQTAAGHLPLRRRAGGREPGRQRRQARRVVVVLSDGADTSSQATLDDAAGGRGRQRRRDRRGGPDLLALLHARRPAADRRRLRPADWSRPTHVADLEPLVADADRRPALDRVRDRRRPAPQHGARA